MFTKQHYESIAHIIHSLNPTTDGEHNLIDELVEELIKFFKSDNLAFIPSKFRDACYGE